MIEIIPAIIPKSFEDLRKKISLVGGLVEYIQIDITDGIFVSSKSWPFDNFVLESETLKLPFLDEYKFEIDLMVNEPEKNIDNWLGFGAERIIFHIESSNKLEELIKELKGKVDVGVAFNIDTSLESYNYLLEKVDFVQLMGIEKIGFQGQEFSEKIFDKIKNLRKIKPNIIISVDGGVSFENAQKLIKAGVNRLVVGSEIFESEDVKETINKLKNLL